MPEKRIHFRKKMRKPRYSVLGRGLGRFYVLALSQKNTRLFSCTPTSIEQKPLNGKTPLSLKASERFLELHKEFQAHAIPSSSKPGFMTHGHGGGRENEKLRIAEFIEDVGDAVEKIMKKEKLPLVLACVGYEASLFRRSGKNAYLVEEIIKGNPDLLTRKELHARGLAIMKKVLRKIHLAENLDSDQTTKL